MTPLPKESHLHSTQSQQGTLCQPSPSVQATAKQVVGPFVATLVQLYKGVQSVSGKLCQNHARTAVGYGGVCTW